MIKLIIFDVGGVIDTFDEKYYIEYITRKLGISPSKFRNALIPMLDKVEVNEMSLVRMKKLLSKKFNISERGLEWDESFIRLNSVNWSVVKLIEKLSKKYKIVLLTNVSRSRHEQKMRLYLEKVKYDEIFASCYLKMNKPNPKIYRFVLKKMHAKPKEAIFVDNLKRNTDGAKRVGIKSIQFTNYGSLVKKLEAMGVY